MPRTGTAISPLHYGKAPSWLFSRMKALSREITYAIVREFGQRELLQRLSDPYWFQALGCVLGFDWHSSGLTTTVTGALKEGLRGMESELGIFMAGGKGAASRKTPEQITFCAELVSIDPAPMIYSSRMSAKVDNTAVQDGYQLYHHVFIFTEKGEWAVVQQGMNEQTRQARRYHWLGSDVKDFVVEPHKAVCCDAKNETLNLVAYESEDARQTATLLSKERPQKVMKELQRIETLELPKRHTLAAALDVDARRLYRTLITTYERQPENFEALLGIGGVGPKAIRALSLVSEIIYGKAPSYRDPARFSFAHGGKDGTPFPVDRRTYDKTVEVIESAIKASKIGDQEKMDALRRMGKYFEA
ncbi:MAG TPA: DUF763 domain-containing protein [Thermodesulfovibrionales bacterium]|jgi:hypothetical protein|nr:DUF763 domain-containing protein [Thermodesulfovibrionales bacterium]